MDIAIQRRMLLLATLSASTIRSALSISRPTTTRIITMAASSKSSFRNPHNLPVKTCVVCNKPFTWRKKWERCWDEVTVCSKRCGAERRGAKRVVAVEGARDSADRDAEDNKRAAKLDRRLAKEERRARRTGQDG